MHRESLLASRSHVTDAQLIIEAYRRWGVDCLKHLIGEFVFILWDASNDLLVCRLRCCRRKDYLILLGWTDFTAIIASSDTVVASPSKQRTR